MAEDTLDIPAVPRRPTRSPSTGPAAVTTAVDPVVATLPDKGAPADQINENFEFETVSHHSEVALDPVATTSGAIDEDHIERVREKCVLQGISGSLQGGVPDGDGNKAHDLNLAPETTATGDSFVELRQRGNSVVGEDVQETIAESQGENSALSSLTSVQSLPGSDSIEISQHEMTMVTAGEDDEPHTNIRPLARASTSEGVSPPPESPEIPIVPARPKRNGGGSSSSSGGGDGDVSDVPHIPRRPMKEDQRHMATIQAPDLQTSTASVQGTDHVPMDHSLLEPGMESVSSDAVPDYKDDVTPAIPSSRPNRSTPASETNEAGPGTTTSCGKGSIQEDTSVPSLPAIPSSRPKRSTPAPANMPDSREISNSESPSQVIPPEPSMRTVGSAPDPNVDGDDSMNAETEGSTDSGAGRDPAIDPESAVAHQVVTPAVPSSRPKRSTPAPEVKNSEASSRNNDGEAEPIKQKASESVPEGAPVGEAKPPPMPASRPARKQESGNPDFASHTVAPNEQAEVGHGAVEMIPAKAKPVPPARPVKKFGATFNPVDAQAGTAPKPKPKPAVGSKIAALRGSLFNDLNAMIAKGPPVPGMTPHRTNDSERELSEASSVPKTVSGGDAEEEDEPRLTSGGDVRRTRAKGPRGKRLPAAAQTEWTTSVGTVWELPLIPQSEPVKDVPEVDAAHESVIVPAASAEPTEVDIAKSADNTLGPDNEQEGDQAATIETSHELAPTASAQLSSSSDEPLAQIPGGAARPTASPERHGEDGSALEEPLPSKQEQSMSTPASLQAAHEPAEQSDESANHVSELKAAAADILDSTPPVTDSSVPTADAELSGSATAGLEPPIPDREPGSLVSHGQPSRSTTETGLSEPGNVVHEQPTADQRSGTPTTDGSASEL